MFCLYEGITVCLVVSQLFLAGLVSGYFTAYLTAQMPASVPDLSKPATNLFLPFWYTYLHTEALRLTGGRLLVFDIMCM